MSEPLLRAMVIGMVLVAVLAVVLLSRAAERKRSIRSPLDLSPVSGSVILFSDAGCRRCDQTRRMLSEAGIAFEEYRHDTDPEVLEQVGVTAVPLVVVRRADGSEAGRIAGRVTKRALRRLTARITNM